MTIEAKQRVYNLVKIICGSTTVFPEAYKHFENPTADIPTNATWLAARELLNEIGVSKAAQIMEIPLCWNNQVAIRFTLGKYDREKNPTVFVFGAGVHGEDPTKFFFVMQVENDNGEFPVEADDDCGIFLIEDIWTIQSDKIIA